MLRINVEVWRNRKTDKILLNDLHFIYLLQNLSIPHPIALYDKAVLLL